MITESAGYTRRTIFCDRKIFGLKRLKMDMTSDVILGNFASVLHSRLYVYDLLRYFFQNPPDKHFLITLSEDSNFLGLAEVSKGTRHIVESIQFVVNDTSSFEMDSLTKEYNRIFIGPDPSPAPLWESVYLSDEHLMFGEETMQVRQFYKRFGLSYVNKANQPDDFLGVELDFMSFLITETLSALEKDDLEQVAYFLDGQSEFLTNHFLRWAPQSMEILLKNTTSRLYQGIALLMIEYLPCELDLINTMKESLAK